jgi:glutathione S-transferase
MAELILHHFDYSPFAEKARLALGLKGLAWASVQIPMNMPRPDLMPLTGGYRKTPVLQIGADVYCDSRLIARELERRFPEPSLFPRGNAGLAIAFSQWSDTAYFNSGAGLSMALNMQNIDKDVIEDRKQFFNFMDFNKLERDVPHMLTQLRANAALLEEQLADGRTFLLGDSPGWVDICAYFPTWMSRTFFAQGTEVFAPYLRMHAWEQRMKAIGHGRRQHIEAQVALDIAKRAEPAAGAGIDPADPLQLTAGARVSVAPDDYGKVPVVGDLVTLALHEVAIRRHDPRVGTVVTHFPRIGYRIERV